MRVLLVVPFLPYPGVQHASGKLCYYLLRTLVERHDVHLVARFSPGEESQLAHLRELASGLDVVEGPGAHSAGTTTTFAAALSSYRRLGILAHQVLTREHFDVCQVEFTETGVFWRPTSTPAVLTCYDIIAKPAKRLYQAARGIDRFGAWGRWRAKQAAERFAVSKFERIFTLSEDDRSLAQGLYPGVSARVLKYPGGLDFVGLPRREAPMRLLLVGAFNRQLNLDAIEWFVDRCWATIRREAPGAELHLVGQGMPEPYRRRWSQAPGLVLVGAVESIEEHYKQAAVFVAPMLTGGGIIVKILDALAAGVPVVTTTRGNEGVAAVVGESILVADNADSFAVEVVRLLRDGELRRSVAESGKRYVENTFSPARFAATVDETYADLVAGARRRRWR